MSYNLKSTKIHTRLMSIFLCLHQNTNPLNPIASLLVPFFLLIFLSSLSYQILLSSSTKQETLRRIYNIADEEDDDDEDEDEDGIFVFTLVLNFFSVNILSRNRISSIEQRTF